MPRVALINKRVHLGYPDSPRSGHYIRGVLTHKYRRRKMILSTGAMNILHVAVPPPMCSAKL